MFFHTSQKPVTTCGEIWRARGMYQHLPAPTMHQILHVTMVMKCYTVLEQNDTMLKQFWFF